MVAGALGALGLWLFVGGPERGALGTGTFSSPDATAPAPGGDAPVAGGVAAATPVDSVADAEARPTAEGDGSPGHDPTTARGGARGAPGEADAGETGARADGGDGGRTAVPLTASGSRSTDPGTRAPLVRAATSDSAAESETSGAARETTRPDPAAARRAETRPERPESRPGASDAPPTRAAPVPSPPEEEAVPATAVEARVAAEVAVAAYARAVESGDIGALRRAHPGLTAENEAAWRRVFEGGETFVAMLRIAEFGADGTEARAGVRGSCHFYDLSLRRFVDVPVEFELYLHHDGRTWRPVLASGVPPDSGP